MVIVTQDLQLVAEHARHVALLAGGQRMTVRDPAAEQHQRFEEPLVRDPWTPGLFAVRGAWSSPCSRPSTSRRAPRWWLGLRAGALDMRVGQPS
ncbi:hypothetical protein [Nonomuraea turcica]|uniref:hypothetical protein n=1 Tax=Nonomuraea sp. G32 TaxID=3067274 RepID=UPI00273C4997|nr:hypothetical protein [Nonomuraea sp. G32]MDP4509315.1 hypothetical protein [Nonomuraea sp. G32]